MSNTPNTRTWQEEFKELYDKSPAFNDIETKQQLIDYVATLRTQDRVSTIKEILEMQSGQIDISGFRAEVVYVNDIKDYISKLKQ